MLDSLSYSNITYIYISSNIFVTTSITTVVIKYRKLSNQFYAGHVDRVTYICADVSKMWDIFARIGSILQNFIPFVLRENN